MARDQTEQLRIGVTQELTREVVQDWLLRPGLQELIEDGTVVAVQVCVARGVGGRCFLYM
jgi:hypothetical protein